MNSKTGIILFVLCSIALLGTAKQNFAANPATAQPQAISRPGPQISAAQAQSLKDDLAKMRSLVKQMETNLSFVDTTQSPLKHQFQLDIDMWRLMIQRMEGRLQETK